MRTIVEARACMRRIVGAVVFLGLTASVMAASTASEGLDALKQLMKSGKYTEAEASARSLLTEVQTARGADAIEAASVLDLLVESLWRGGKAREPESYALAEKAVEIKTKALGPDHPEVAVSLNNLGNLVRSKGDYSAARPLLERALAIREKALGPDHLDVARSLNSLGVLLFTTADYAGARPLWERTLAIREKALEPQDPDVATSVNNLAALLFKMGDYAAARPLLERALRIREKTLGPDHPDVAASLDNLAILSQSQGDYRAARALYERAVAIREKALGPDHPELAGTLNNLATLMFHAGDYSAALPLYERSLAIKEKALGPDHDDVALTLDNVAVLASSMGDFIRARQLEERALAIREKTLGPDHPEVALSLNNLAIVMGSMGDYHEERRLQQRALSIREKALGPDHPEVAYSLAGLALPLESMGEYAAARPLLERALAIREKAFGPDHPSVAMSLQKLATLHLNMDDYTGARTLFQRALTTREKVLGPDHPDVATTLYLYATLLQMTRENDLARSFCERALAIQRKSFGSDHPYTATVLSVLARSLAAEGEISDALDAALEAESISREHLQRTGRALTEAQTLSYAAARANGLDLALTLVAKGLESESRRRVFDALVRSRTVVLDQMAARHRAVIDASDPKVAQLADALARSRSRLANLILRGRGDQKPESYRKWIDDARDEEERDERRLAEASAEFARERSLRVLGIDEISASLTSGSALVAFAQYNKIDLAVPRPPTSPGDHPRKPKDVSSYLAFVLRSGERDPRVVDLGAADATDDRVARWEEEVSKAGSVDAYRRAGTTLRRAVWDPLVPALGNAERVFIVPDGSLNLVNLASLPVADGGYLIEHGPLLHFVSAERDLLTPADRKPKKGLLAIGAPSYDATSLFASLRKGKESAGSPKAGDAPILVASTAVYRGQRAACDDFTSLRFGPLPGTGKETRDVIRMWESHRRENPAHEGDVLDLRGADASETALKQSAAHYRVLHIATHGFFLGGRSCESALAGSRGVGGLTKAEPAREDGSPPPVKGESPLRMSGLALAGANHRSSAAEGEDDGILTAEEIASLDLSGVEWAVLSACETGVGDVRSGEGVFGLRRAFQVAGAATLIMSLWSVDDEATRSWMHALYEGRLARRLDTAQAARQASLTVIQQRRKAGQSLHPFFWAAFVAAGAWR